MMKEIRFCVTLALLVLAVGFGTFRQLRARDVPLQETPGTQQAIPHETAESSELSTELHVTAVTAEPKEPQTEIPCTESAEEEPVCRADEPWLPASKITEVRGKLDVLSDLSEDLIGWLYLAETDIDYPVVKGEDNQFYLDHAPDRTPNRMGTIFLDRQCSRDFSGNRNILYGHNFERGMFGTLRSFKERQNYDAHPYGWLFTADCVYRIEFFALVIVPADDQVFLDPSDAAAWQTAIEEHSLYRTGETPQPEERCIALSTCASDFEDARELLIGRMCSLTDAEVQTKRQDTESS